MGGVVTALCSFVLELSVKRLNRIIVTIPYHATLSIKGFGDFRSPVPSDIVIYLAAHLLNCHIATPFGFVWVIAGICRPARPIRSMLWLR